MPNYKTMYFKLFNAVCDAMELLRQTTIETENMVADGKDPITLEDVVRPQKEAPPE
ncbi:MAG: hypothetical protein GXY32_11105 [Ruminococcaceae bacterium]|nr:hypothetical protein [Oscillospiraceae bacterium]